MASLDTTKLLGFPHMSSSLRQVNSHLNDIVSSIDNPIADPLARLVNSGSKRLRPALILSILAAHDRKTDTKAIAAATAVELLHLGSLVHDDVIDNASIRWKQPTISHQEGSGLAIIAGDFLFAKAAHGAAQVDSTVALILAEALAALCEGQAVELADQFNAKRTIANMTRAINGKTASLFKASCEIGAHCAGLNTYEIKAFGAYGEAFGMAFQLLDDVMDFLSETALSGKSICGDVMQGVYTMPVIEMLRRTSVPAMQENLLNDFDAKDNSLIDMMFTTGAFDSTLTSIKDYNLAAVSALRPLPKTAGFNSLRAFPAQYTEWTLEHMVAKRHRDQMVKMI